MEQVFVSHSEAETEDIGRTVAGFCNEGDFLAMYGDMGSGKTVFMRGFVSQFAPNARVSSPTYAILNVYEGDGIHINHFDLYRITSDDDLASTGFDEVIQRGITVCEWSENIPESLPDSYLRIVFEKISENDRNIRVERVVG